MKSSNKKQEFMRRVHLLMECYEKNILSSEELELKISSLFRTRDLFDDVIEAEADENTLIYEGDPGQSLKYIK